MKQYLELLYFISPCYTFRTSDANIYLFEFMAENCVILMALK